MCLHLEARATVQVESTSESTQEPGWWFADRSPETGPGSLLGSSAIGKL